MATIREFMQSQGKSVYVTEKKHMVKIVSTEDAIRVEKNRALREKIKGYRTMKFDYLKGIMYRAESKVKEMEAAIKGMYFAKEKFSREQNWAMISNTIDGVRNMKVELAKAKEELSKAERDVAAFVLKTCGGKTGDEIANNI